MLQEFILFEIKVMNRSRRRETRLLEKQMRPEIVERCLEFLDIVINQIIYQESIYNKEIFVPRQKYKSLIYQCMDTQISSYITLCVASIRHLLDKQLCDMIAVNIVQRKQASIILRRYLIEFHTLHDPCLRAIYENSKEIILQVEQAFSKCLEAIKQVKPLQNNHRSNSLGWTFQFRSCPGERNSKGLTVQEVLRKTPIYKQFILINQQSELLSSGKDSLISSFKSLHTERVQLQFMCEDDKYEQKSYFQNNPTVNSIEEDKQQESEGETSFKARNPSEHGSSSESTDVNSSDDEEEKKSRRRKRNPIKNIDSEQLTHQFGFLRDSQENNNALEFSSSDDEQFGRLGLTQNLFQAEEEDDQI